MVGPERTADDDDGTDSGWSLVESYDGAAAILAAALEMDPDTEYTRSELCDVTDVPYKTLYLAGTVDALADAGLFETRESTDGETTFAVDVDGAVYAAAAAFAEATESAKRVESV